MGTGDRSRRGGLLLVVSALVGINLLAFFVFARVDQSLQAEERERLGFIARTLGLEIARRVPLDLTSAESLNDLLGRFERARRVADLEAVFLADRDGVVIAEARGDEVRIRSRFLDAADRDVAGEVWRGQEVFAPAVGEGRREGGCFYYPVFSLGGEVRYVLGMVAGSAFRARLDRFSPMLLVSRFFGVALLGLFAFLLLITLRRTLSEGRERGGERGERAGRGDTDFVIQTFHEIVTNLKESESELKSLYNRAEERASTLEKVVAYMLRTLPTGVLIFDRDRRVLLVNAAARDILGLARRDYRGEPAASVFGALPEFTRLLEDLLENGKTKARHEVRLPDREGEEAWAGLSTSVIRDPAGSLLGGAFLVADLSETKRLRKRVALKDRLAAMGEVSAGITHELRNSLATLLGYCRLAGKETAPTSPARDYLDKILAEIRVLEETSNRLLDFVRPGTRHLVSVDPDDLALAAVRAVEERSGDPLVRVETRLAAGGARVEADRTALRKALENLIENGFQAMPAGGTLLVETRVMGAARADARTDGEEGLLEIVVRDTGIGIPPERIDRVFAPFYTTREKGTGLGLPIVQKTIAEHDGTIEVASRVGEGTTFRILLPCALLAGAGARSADGGEVV
jgi:PAS domain S-box-containing protein